MNPDQNQQNQQLDPTIVALTKAIGSAESGGKYKAPSGDKGSPPSAYQFTPGFIQNYAPKYLGQGYDPENLTPEQQDKLAYGVVKDWGTTGNPSYPHLGKLSPAQIASAWNTGDPNAYLDPEYGKNNAYGSTALYVDKVKANYDKNLQESGVQQPKDQGIIPTAEASGNQTEPSQGGGILDWLFKSNPQFASQVSATIPKAGQPMNPATAGSLIAAGVAGVGLPALIAGGADLLSGKGTISGALKMFGADQLLNAATGKESTPSSGGITQPQPDILSELNSLQIPQASQSSKTVSDALMQALGVTPTGRTQLQDPNVKSAIGAMGIYGFAPQTDEFGAMDFTEANKKRHQAIVDLSTNVEKALETEGQNIPVQEAVSRAKQNIRENTPSNQWAEADKHIEDQAKEYEKNFGSKEGLSLGGYERMKRELGHGQKWGVLDSSAKRSAYKALSSGARETIVQHTQNPDLYNATMKEEQKLINAKGIMKRLSGKRAPQAGKDGLMKMLFQMTRKYAPIYIADKIGGPVGAVLGAMVGEKLANAFDKRYGKTIFETPAMHRMLDSLHEKTPPIYRALINELKKHQIQVIDKDQMKGSGFPEGLLKKSLEQSQSKKKENKQPSTKEKHKNKKKYR